MKRRRIAAGQRALWVNPVLNGGSAPLFVNDTHYGYKKQEWCGNPAAAGFWARNTRMKLDFDNAILHPGALSVLLEDGSEAFGICQDWLPGKWKQLAGCGPCTAANILFYLSRRDPALASLCSAADDSARQLTRAQSVEFVCDIWKDLAPGPKGVNTVGMFTQGALAFARRRGVELAVAELLIPGAGVGPRSLSECADFIEKGLKTDCPVAFLNLSNGAETALDNWHWVAIVSMRRDPDGRRVLVEFADNTEKKTADFSLWFDTTTRGGALAYFKR